MRTDWQKDETMFWSFFIIGMLSNDDVVTAVSMVNAGFIGGFHLRKLWKKTRV